MKKKQFQSLITKLVERKLKEKQLLKEELFILPTLAHYNSELGGSNNYAVDYESLKQLLLQDPNLKMNAELIQLVKQIETQLQEWKRMEERYAQLAKLNIDKFNKILFSTYGVKYIQDAINKTNTGY